MTRADTLHSRLIGTLRLALPLAALGLVSTLFLFSRDIDPSRALPYAAVDAEDLARDPRITAPRFSGVTDDGTAVLLTAETVRIASGTDETVSARLIAARFESPDGRRATFRADTATLDRAADTLALAGNVRIDTAEGHSIRTRTLDARLDTVWAHSPGPVTAETPGGRIEAGNMLLQPHPTAPGHLLQFAGGVRMVYHPQAAPPHPQASP